MTTYYEVLRPVEQADLDTSPTLADVLRVIPPPVNPKVRLT